MKKIVFFVFLVLLSLCSCKKDSSVDSNDRNEKEVLENSCEEDLTRSTDEEDSKEENDSELNNSDDKVYNDDVDWGPLT